MEQIRRRGMLAPEKEVLLDEDDEPICPYMHQCSATEDFADLDDDE